MRNSRLPTLATLSLTSWMASTVRSRLRPLDLFFLRVVADALFGLVDQLAQTGRRERLQGRGQPFFFHLPCHGPGQERLPGGGAADDSFHAEPVVGLLPGVFIDEGLEEVLA